MKIVDIIFECLPLSPSKKCRKRRVLTLKMVCQNYIDKYMHITTR